MAVSYANKLPRRCRPGSYDLSVSDGYAPGVSTPIEVTSRVLVETLSSIAHVDDVVAATLSGSLNHTGASCTFDGNAKPADVVDGTRIYCQSPSDEMRAAVTLSSANGALPLRGAGPLEVAIKQPPLIHSVEPPLSSRRPEYDGHGTRKLPITKTILPLRRRQHGGFGPFGNGAAVPPITHEARTVPFDVGYSRGEASRMSHMRSPSTGRRALVSVKPRSAAIGTSVTIQNAAPDDLALSGICCLPIWQYCGGGRAAFST